MFLVARGQGYLLVGQLLAEVSDCPKIVLFSSSQPSQILEKYSILRDEMSVKSFDCVFQENGAKLAYVK